MGAAFKFGSGRLSRNDLILVAGAFLAYTGMYAVRKSFLAAQFDDVSHESELTFKTLLIASQLIGYLLSKFIGIKVIAEVKPQARFRLMVSLVSFGLLMLLAFAFVPIPLKPYALFLNGLPLGMVFGLVLSYLEGRHNSELLIVGLTATFIFSTGFIKTIGGWLMHSVGVDQFWMPFATGLLFFPVFLVAARAMHKADPPSEMDKELRTERIPMNNQVRRLFLKKHGLAFMGLVMIYILLSVLRDFRDNFIVEFWADMGEAGRDRLLTMTELPIAIGVLIISGLGVLILSNRLALITGLVLTILCALGMFVVSYIFTLGWVSPLWWTILSGGAIYLPYILFHCLIFERFLAFLRFKGTIGYLFYIADALGYLGSVGVLLFKEGFRVKYSFVDFFLGLNVWGGLGILIVSGIAAVILQKRKQLFFGSKTIEVKS